MSLIPVRTSVVTECWKYLDITVASACELKAILLIKNFVTGPYFSSWYVAVVTICFLFKTMKFANYVCSFGFYWHANYWTHVV
jgi:hypothetical protein